MASGLLAVVDDIATLLDDMALMAKVAANQSSAATKDVATMTKVAAQKTAGVLGDDLALNAQQVSGFSADKELRVVWDVAKGSFKNKAILIPAALAATAFAPYLITPTLMAGGLYLCYEGSEKIIEKLFHKKEDGEKEHIDELKEMSPEDLEKYESEKVKGAIRTDLILSGEIIVIALGTMANAPFLSQALTLTTVGAAMTVGVYGSVAGLVKIDDLGFKLMKSENKLVQKTGELLVDSMPYIMKGLTVAGTAAMFLVGGSILAHGVSALGPLTHAGGMTAMAVEAGVGLAAGTAAVGVHHVVKDYVDTAWSKIKSIFKSSNDNDDNQPPTRKEPVLEDQNNDVTSKVSLENTTTITRNIASPVITESLYSSDLTASQIEEVKELSRNPHSKVSDYIGNIVLNESKIGTIEYTTIKQIAKANGVDYQIDYTNSSSPSLN